jgi:hypothetical protein
MRPLAERDRHGIFEPAASLLSVTASVVAMAAQRFRFLAFPGRNIRLMKIGTRVWPLAVILTLTPLLTDCGENAEDKANRTALVPLVHRNRALSDEYARWVKNNEIGGTVTYREMFDQYDKFEAAKDSLQADVRKVVPTPKYDCLIGLLGKSIAADVAAMAAREEWSRHRVALATASDLFDRYLAEARASEYGGGTYLQSAREQLADAEKQRVQVQDFKQASNANSLAASALGDSLVAGILSFKLLPSVERPAYAIVTDTGRDSLTKPSGVLPANVCVAK